MNQQEAREVISRYLPPDLRQQVLDAFADRVQSSEPGEAEVRAYMHQVWERNAEDARARGWSPDGHEVRFVERIEGLGEPVWVVEFNLLLDLAGRMHRVPSFHVIRQRSDGTLTVCELCKLWSFKESPLC